MSELDKIRQPVAREMEEFEGLFRNSMKSNIPLLNLIIKFLLRTKGKQIRPVFVFLSARLHGAITPSTYVAASLIELLHTATLIHDDVVDESYERRGFFSINVLWKSKVAVLFGDYLLARGLLVAVEGNEFELLRIVSEAVQEMSEGELLQIQKSRKNGISPDEYFEIIRKKTATLIAACTTCGAYSVGAPADVTKQMKQFGEYAGMAFQIRDDLLDYQKKGFTGKPTGNDIKEGKYTLPLIIALQNADLAEQRKIRRLMRSKQMSRSTIESIIQFTEDYGGIAAARVSMAEYRDKALAILETFPKNEAKEALTELVYFITSREH